MDDGGRELLLPLVDEENICLPLPINAVARYWDMALPVAEAAESAKKYSGFGGGILIEGIELAEAHGLSCKLVRSSLDGLRQTVDLGIPPIVILPGIPEITQHASVITGYDSAEKTILHYIQKGTRDGEQQEGAIPQETFDGEWSEEGRLLLAIAPPDIMSSANHLGDDGRPGRLCLEAERQTVLGNPEGALESLRQAVLLDGTNPVALNQLGAALSAQNSPDCVQYYEKCIRANPRAYLAFNGLGNYCLKTGQLAEAEGHYTEAIRINPKRSAKIYKNRAYLREKLGNAGGAKEDLQSYLRYLPKAPDRGAIEQAIREL